MVETVARVLLSGTLIRYRYNNKKFVANSAEVQIPAALASGVKGVVRLHSDPRSESYIGGKVHFDKRTGHFEGADGGHYLTPADFATIYNVQPLYNVGASTAQGNQSPLWVAATSTFRTSAISAISLDLSQ